MDTPDYDYLRGLFTRAVESGTSLFACLYSPVLIWIYTGKYGDPKTAVFDWIPGAKNKYFAGQAPRSRGPKARGPGHGMLCIMQYAIVHNGK